jgi:hypothetical protein
VPSPAFVTASGRAPRLARFATVLNPTATWLGSQPAGGGVGGIGVTTAVGAGVGGGVGAGVGGSIGRGVGRRVGVAVAVDPLVGVPDGRALAPGNPLGDVDGEWDGARVAVGRADGEPEARAARDGDAEPDGAPVPGAGVVPHAATATDTNAARRRRRTDAPSITRRI